VLQHEKQQQQAEKNLNARLSSMEEQHEKQHEKQQQQAEKRLSSMERA
jgi:hypothetical protein